MRQTGSSADSNLLSQHHLMGMMAPTTLGKEGNVSLRPECLPSMFKALGSIPRTEGCDAAFIYV